MSKHKTKAEWVRLFKEFEKYGRIPEEYYAKLSLKPPSEAKAKSKKVRSISRKIQQAKIRF